MSPPELQRQLALLRAAERQVDKDEFERAECVRLQIEIDVAKRRLAKKCEHKLDVVV